MTALEIIMLIIGIVCFAASFMLTSDDAEPVTNKRKSSYKPELSKEQMNMIRDQVDEVVNEQLSMLEESTEAALDKISNTKIMEMNEYAESVLSEINKNHNETVFMYDMLNEKSNEIKALMRDISSVRNDIDVVKATMNADTDVLQNLIKDAEKSVKEMDIAIKAAYKTRKIMDVHGDNEAKEKNVVEDVPVVALDNVITPKAFELKADDVAGTVNEYNYMAKVEPETIIASNYNEQILYMHSEGKSNLEIAKTLNLGMGEVKLVIDLYNSRK